MLEQFYAKSVERFYKTKPEVIMPNRSGKALDSTLTMQLLQPAEER